MKAIEVYDNVYTRPYAEDDALLNDYVEDIHRIVSWHLFERQDDICYNISICNPPKLKDEAPDIIAQEIRKELGWIVDYLICRILIEYRLSNVDLGEEGEWELIDRLGKEEYEEFEKVARGAIYDDYVKYLGVEKANDYFRKIGRPEYIKKEDSK